MSLLLWLYPVHGESSSRARLHGCCADPMLRPRCVGLAILEASGRREQELHTLPFTRPLSASMSQWLKTYLRKCNSSLEVVSVLYFVSGSDSVR